VGKETENTKYTLSSATRHRVWNHEDGDIMKLVILIGLVWATTALVSVSVAQQISIAANSELNSFTYYEQASSSGQLSNSSQTDEQISSAVDAYVEVQRREQHIPGVAMAVIRGGRLLKAHGYGLANVELDVPVKPETIFQTGSVGKQFTATAVMMLVEKGKVGLDDKITKYIPESPAAWKDVNHDRVQTVIIVLQTYDQRIAERD
jgi:CubicO group peptidase (beta-lactamase class C family)